MGQLREEVKTWNTPATGAYLLWRFTDGYVNNHAGGDAPPGILHFIASGILTNHKLIESVNNQRKNLQSYARSFEDKKGVDILLGLQRSINAKKEYTMASIDIAVSSGLLAWDKDNAKLYSCDLKNKPGRGKALRVETVKIGNRAEVLGKWFSVHDVSTIAAYLKVVL